MPMNPCCPFCGAEYAVVDRRCWDCRVALDDPPEPTLPEDQPENEVVFEIEDWPGFQWEITEPQKDLWLYAEESANVANVGQFVRALLSRFRPTACWSMTYAVASTAPALFAALLRRDRRRLETSASTQS